LSLFFSKFFLLLVKGILRIGKLSELWRLQPIAGNCMKSFNHGGVCILGHVEGRLIENNAKSLRLKSDLERDFAASVYLLKAFSTFHRESEGGE
jgi:hypothetical protein